jgi:hypothetical protein
MDDRFLKKTKGKLVHSEKEQNKIKLKFYKNNRI